MTVSVQSPSVWYLPRGHALTVLRRNRRSPLLTIMDRPRTPRMKGPTEIRPPASDKTRRDFTIPEGKHLS
jgi:hypothetical protein